METHPPNLKKNFEHDAEGFYTIVFSGIDLLPTNFWWKKNELRLQIIFIEILSKTKKN